MRYHYVITLQFEARNGIQRVSWASGLYEPAAGQTRAEVFTDLFRQVADRIGGDNPAPLFFSLEPDEL